LDGDDWLAQEKLRKIAEVFSIDSALGMIGHTFIESFDNGAQKTIFPHDVVRSHVNNVSAAKFFRLSRCYFGTSRLALRAHVARKILPVPEALVFLKPTNIFSQWRPRWSNLRFCQMRSHIIACMPGVFFWERARARPENAAKRG
jgi:hypothetical protein